ncbi:hypothetical protein QFC21_000177 [Naganishia friedmannii]|uniref:Uncharacterized protein n=1 Tax=Naganishia friedmannii TaxID=89922 RepID=A0ACC2WEB1_9TREE|nr:hypothetical protein QFC21_000177 [Naganishia friedmannii]
MFFPETFEDEKKPVSRSPIHMTYNQPSGNIHKADAMSPSTEYSAIASPSSATADMFQLTSIVTELAVSHQELHDRTHQAVYTWEKVAGELMRRMNDMSVTIQDLRGEVAILKETQVSEKEWAPDGNILRKALSACISALVKEVAKRQYPENLEDKIYKAMVLEDVFDPANGYSFGELVVEAVQRGYIFRSAARCLHLQTNVQLHRA